MGGEGLGGAPPIVTSDFCHLEPIMAVAAKEVSQTLP